MPLFLPAIAPYVFAAGALCFCPIQMSDRYEGSNMTIRRLRRQQMLGALAFAHNCRADVYSSVWYSSFSWK